MNKTSKLILILVTISLTLTGCGSLRFTPTEAQKQSAWLHHRGLIRAADLADMEETSDTLQALTHQAVDHSETMVRYFGLPHTLPPADTDEQLLNPENLHIIQQAKNDALQRPNPWLLADHALELGIALAGILGGVYGKRLADALQQARQKSKALKEIVQGNELFKQQNREHTEAFKQAHRQQSNTTRQLVTACKTNETA